MKEDDFESLVEESRARSLDEKTRNGNELCEDELFDFVSESVQHRDTLTGVDALTAHVNGSKAFHEDAEDKQMRALLERLDREIVVSSSSAGIGDFRLNNMPAPGHQTITVSGNTYDIKDKLKKMGFKFDPRSKMWVMKASISEFRGRRGPSEKSMKSAEQKVRDLAATMNKKWRDEDAEQLKAAGHSKMKFPKDPKGMMKMVDAKGRVKNAFEKKGVQMKFGQGMIQFTGNTYPLRNVFKKNQFAWKGGAWVMKFDNYAIVQERFVKEAMQALRSTKAPQQDTETSAPDVGINRRLRHYKDNKQFVIDQRKAAGDRGFAAVFDERVAAGYYDESINDVDPKDASKLFESLMDVTEMPAIEEAKETFKAAKIRLLDFLKKGGWDTSPTLKVPKAVDKHAGKVIYFKPQAVYAGSFSPRQNPNSLGETRSLWADIRGMSGEDFLKAVDDFLK